VLVHYLNLSQTSTRSKAGQESLREQDRTARQTDRQPPPDSRMAFQQEFMAPPRPGLPTGGLPGHAMGVVNSDSFLGQQQQQLAHMMAQHQVSHWVGSSLRRSTGDR
jgi:hypothetical protein